MLGPQFSLKDDSRVCYDGREELKRFEMGTYVSLSINKRLRRSGRFRHFLESVDVYGAAELRWNFTRRLKARDDHWAELRAWQVGGDYRLLCGGPRAEDVLEKVNASLVRKAPRKIRRRLHVNRIRARHERAARKRKELLAKQAAPRPVKKSKEQRLRERYARNGIPRLFESLTPQFRHNQASWKEATKVVADIFQARGTLRQSARDVVLAGLWGSLFESNYQFAQYAASGFTLRFTPVDGMRFVRSGRDWIPQVESRIYEVSCSKDNKHFLYRRMRSRLKKLFLGHSLQEQSKRKAMLAKSSHKLVA